MKIKYVNVIYTDEDGVIRTCPIPWEHLASMSRLEIEGYVKSKLGRVL